MNIIVAQYWTKNISYKNYTKSINEKYCKNKNYIYYIEDDDEKIIQRLGQKSFHWYKPLLILDVFEKYNPDYVLFLDADAIFVNEDYNIEDFIVSNKDIVVTEDYGPSEVNSGVILIKNSEWSKYFLKRWYDTCEEMEGGNPPSKGYYSYGLWWDQTGFSYLLKNDEKIKEKVKIIDNKVLNGRQFNDPVNKNFIFHAFSYGAFLNRTIDAAYYSIFNIPIPSGEQLLDIIQYYSTDKHSTHRYFDLVYNELFRPLKNECKIFIEIGIYDGESVKLWRDYFTNATIVGIEYNLPWSLEKLGNTSKERLVLLNMDQSKEEDMVLLSEMYSLVDVILDDGSHKMYDQQMTFAKLFKMLKPGGIYIIEDLHTSLEVLIPEKKVYNWGDESKTTTLNVLENYIKTKKLYSDYMTEDEMEFLNNHIESIEIYKESPQWSFTSIIKKKK